MYVGGMAGTGEKSQVIKALMNFFTSEMNLIPQRCLDHHRTSKIEW